MNKKLNDKIAKLLALAESSNVNEATLAMSKARELLDRHNLSMSDIEWQDKLDSEPIARFIVNGFDMYGEQNYRRNTFGTELLYMLAKHNSCISYGWIGSNSHTIVGGKSDVDMTISMFKTIYPIIQTECDMQYAREYNKLERHERWRMRNWKKSFRSGAYWKIDERLTDLRTDLENEYAGSMALIRLDRSEEVRVWADENIETRTTRSSSKSGWNSNGNQAGKAFGATVPLNRQIGE